MKTPAPTLDCSTRESGWVRAPGSLVWATLLAVSWVVLLVPRADAQVRARHVAVNVRSAPHVQSDSVDVKEASLFGFEVGLSVAAVVVISRKRRR